MALEMSDETTLRDTIETALDDATAGDTAPVESAAPIETAEETEARAERARDEAGRFTKAEKAAQATAEAAAAPAEPEAPSRPQRPSSWKKDYQAKWDMLVDSDPEMANYLLERESQYAKGVSTYKNEADRAREFHQLLEPHAPRFQQYGVEPTQYLGRLLEIDSVLASGSPQQKLALLQSIASAVGVAEYLGQPPGDGQHSGYVPPELMNTLTALQNKVETWEQQQARAEQARINQEIDAFAEKAEYLDDLKDDMAQLLEAGLAANLQEAYDKALRLRDDIFEQHQAQQRQRQEADRQAAARQAAQRARSAAVSPRSGTPTGSAAGSASPQGDDIRGILSAALDAQAGGGRI